MSTNAKAIATATKSVGPCSQPMGRYSIKPSAAVCRWCSDTPKVVAHHVQESPDHPDDEKAVDPAEKKSQERILKFFLPCPRPQSRSR